MAVNILQTGSDLRSKKYNSFEAKPPFFFAPLKTRIFRFNIQHVACAARELGIVPDAMHI